YPAPKIVRERPQTRHALVPCSQDGRPPPQRYACPLTPTRPSEYRLAVHHGIIMPSCAWRGIPRTEFWLRVAHLKNDRARKIAPRMHSLACRAPVEPNAVPGDGW